MSRPLHPLLFAVFPLLFLVAHNADVIGPSEAGVPLLITIAVVAFAQIIGSIVFRSSRKIAIVISIFALLFFSYGHVWTALHLSDGLLIPLWLFLGGSTIFSVVRSHRRLADLTRVLNIIAVMLTATTLAGVVSDLVSTEPARTVTASGTATHRAIGRPRDIYYLIFDRYADQQTLKTHFGFDNAPFVTALEDKGFVVTPGSRANYQNTHMSLASSLNMQHLSTLTADVPKPSTDREPIFDLVRNNDVARFLKSSGYRYVHVGSWASYTASSPLADVNLKPLATSEFTRALYGSTALAPILRGGGTTEGDDSETQRDATRGAFRALDGAIGMDGPKYVFAHFIIPHPPYVFDRNGDYSKEGKREGNVEGYLEQVRYANKQIERIIDRLLSVAAEKRPIVVIQADEGPYPRLSTRFPTSWATEPAADVRVKYGILNAYHLPGQADVVYPSISPVNSFRVIFNRYFGERLPLLPDESYAVARKSDAYTWVPLGDLVKATPAPFVR